MRKYSYTFWNNLTGWAVFAVAAVTYLLTMEPSASLWDCSEFIATSYKLEVGHPPGAPLFMLMARIATMLAPSAHYVPHMVNAMNALASAFCILFMFWTITHIARRMLSRSGDELPLSDTIAVLGAGAVGALAYTFTDTFWFSAVEGEVYALSSMFTSLVVWLMLKWEEQADEPHSARWIVLIAYLMGLSIGVHILNLLTIPALVFIYYFRKCDRATLKGIALTTLTACVILLVINGIIIPYTVYVGAMLDVFFVNTLHLPLNSGMIVFCLLVFGALGWGIYFTHSRGYAVWNTVLLSLAMILLGFSSYASITIRAAANPPMNSNDPYNPHSLLSMLNRAQYGSRPLLYGPYYSAQDPVEAVYKTQWYFDRDTKRYVQAEVLDHYRYDARFMHLFPRMWDSHKTEDDYKPWAAYRTKTDVLRDENGDVIRDEAGRAVRGEVTDYGHKVRYDNGYETVTVVEPTFGENLNYFFSYQLNYMYWRYFLWNFVGRQNDIQASTSTISDGNWASGIKAIDRLYLGPQEYADKQTAEYLFGEGALLPDEIASNRARNFYYFLPFILGLIGLIYQLNRDPRNFSIVMWLFVMMGVALVVYFNSSPGEVRERDYVYAGSFYAFSMWIGLGVIAVKDLFAYVLRRERPLAAVAATVVCLGVPTLLAAQNWDDHDRSHRTMARDMGWNYLQSTLPNAIMLNYGDNDTFPLWFNQEVDGVRTDVRLMNTSYLDAEWYVDEMKTAANDAEGVSFSLPRSKYFYTNDFIPVEQLIDRTVEIDDVIEFIRSEDSRTKTRLVDGTVSDYIPTTRIALPVNKENALASGIVAEKDRDLMVDTVYINIDKGYIARSDMMLLDMLANFDWKRPIHFTQVYILQKFGLLDYLQYDGYSYRLVPIYTPYQNAWEIGRIDPDYVYPLLMNTFRYGNLSDERVYSDYFTQYNLGSSRARESFARVAKEFIARGENDKALALLDRGLEVLPVDRIRYSDSNTYPFIEAYYWMKEYDKGDALLRGYMTSLMQYIEYYLGFDGRQGDLVAPIIDEKFASLWQLYYLAAYAGRTETVDYLNEYFRSFGVSDDDLVDTSSSGDVQPS